MKRPDGTSLKTTQRADYDKSVHATALMKQHDQSAPTCNDCHGNHGATPPGVDAVSNVCGTCHASIAARFATSPHKPVLEKACVECHGNHAVLEPADEMLGRQPPAVCLACHTDNDDPGAVGAGKMRADIERLKREITSASSLIERVKRAGMEVADQEVALAGVRSQLVLARTEVHAFNPTTFTPVVGEGLKLAAGVDRAGQNALSELAFRRRGLGISLVVILLMVVALAFKIRDVDRRNGD